MLQETSTARRGGWQARGTWTVPGAVAPPTVDGVTPASGSGESDVRAPSIPTPADLRI